MIVARKRQSQKAKVSPIGVRPTKGGYLPAAYEVGKIALKSLGYYQDIEPYLPDKYIDKYTYKPHKRLAGYLGQTIQKKLQISKRNASGYKFSQKGYDSSGQCWNNSTIYRNCKGNR